MAETAKAYNNAPKHLMNGDIVIGTSTIKAMLLTAYTPAQTHDTIADVLAAGTEAAGSGYTTRGATVTASISASGAVTKLAISAGPTWTTANPGTLTGAFIVYYKDTGTNSTSFVIAYDDLGGTQTATNGGTFSQDQSAGVLTVTVS
jgi:hypothetical protein